MPGKKEKHPSDHVIILTSDAADAKVKQYRVRPWIVYAVVVIICVMAGMFIGCFLYENKVWEVANKRIAEQQEIVVQREEEIAGLKQQLAEAEAEAEQLNEKIALLSETVTQKSSEAEELLLQLEQQALPTEFPLNGTASMEEVLEGDPIYIFTVAEDVMVVAAASGTVVGINEDAEYGHSVWVDHGNGYVTIYRNQGNVQVKLGDTVVKGTVIYVIGSDNSRFGYQIMKDREYIDPAEILSIKG